jgi:hypothetical protein
LVSKGARGAPQRLHGHARCATAPAERLIDWTGWRGLFELLAAATTTSAVVIYLAVPDPVVSARKSATLASLKTVYADSRFWRLAPLSATCVWLGLGATGIVGGAFTDVEGLDRTREFLIRTLRSLSSSPSRGVSVQLNSLRVRVWLGRP